MEAHGGVISPPAVEGGEDLRGRHRAGGDHASGRRSGSELGVDAVYVAVISGMYLTNAKTFWALERPFSIFSVGIGGLAFGYGITVILTSGRRGGVVPAWLGLNVNPGARAWFGLAIVLPLLIGGLGACSSEPGPSARSQILFTVFFFAPAVIAAGCVLLSRACSYREIKKAIVSCVAPSYVMSHDHFWWWDGAQWASAPRQLHLRLCVRQTAITGGLGATGAHCRRSHRGCQRRPGLAGCFRERCSRLEPWRLHGR